MLCCFLSMIFFFFFLGGGEGNSAHHMYAGQTSTHNEHTMDFLNLSYCFSSLLFFSLCVVYNSLCVYVCQVGVPELGDGRRMKISRKLLQEMNLAQLQVLVNDLHSQIESESSASTLFQCFSLPHSSLWFIPQTYCNKIREHIVCAFVCSCVVSVCCPYVLAPQWGAADAEI